MTRNVFTVLAVGALLVSPAQAQGVFQQNSVKVFYGDLDLSKPAGMQTLQRRLRSASLEVCGDSRGALRIGTNDQARCAHDAVADALAAVGKAQNRVDADYDQIRSR
jgi:UrcA family protein